MFKMLNISACYCYEYCFIDTNEELRMETEEKRLALWFEEIDIEDVENVGGKSASLGEMTAKTGVPVSYGFATTKAAFDIFMSQEGLSERIKTILERLWIPRIPRCSGRLVRNFAPP